MPCASLQKLELRGQVLAEDCTRLLRTAHTPGEARRCGPAEGEARCTAGGALAPQNTSLLEHFAHPVAEFFRILHFFARALPQAALATSAGQYVCIGLLLRALRRKRLLQARHLFPPPSFGIVAPLLKVATAKSAECKSCQAQAV